MSLLVPNEGEVEIGEIIVNKKAPTTWTLKLFKDDHTPADGDTAASFTEADFPGYSPIQLLGANWTSTPGAPTLMQHPQQIFTLTQNISTMNIYGYYCVNGNNKLMTEERFSDGPYPLSEANNKIRVTPKFQIKKQGE